MLIVSFIRHGESLDNLRPTLWAGHKDAELTELGVRQVKALGESYANVRLDAIITSDLKRAHATAIGLLDGQPDPKPPLVVERDLREQCFGDAEGITCLTRQIPGKSLDDHFKDGQYPMLFDRNKRFPNGESSNDLVARAERTVDELVLKPYLSRAISSGVGDVHVAVVSHGLCISELIPAMLKRNDGGIPTDDYKSLLNTAWTRVTVQVKPGEKAAEVTDELENLPPLVVTVTDVNRHEHIINVKRQKGIVEYDAKQRSIREFFGGGGMKKHVGVPVAGVEERN